MTAAAYLAARERLRAVSRRHGYTLHELRIPEGEDVRPCVFSTLRAGVARPKARETLEQLGALALDLDAGLEMHVDAGGLVFVSVEIVGPPTVDTVARDEVAA